MWIKSDILQHVATKLVNRQQANICNMYILYIFNISYFHVNQSIHSYDTPMILSTKLLKICVSGAG